mgnify:CR=1 FL=1
MHTCTHFEANSPKRCIIAVAITFVESYLRILSGWHMIAMSRRTALVATSIA